MTSGRVSKFPGSAALRDISRRKQDSDGLRDDGDCSRELSCRLSVCLHVDPLVFGSGQPYFSGAREEHAGRTIQSVEYHCAKEPQIIVPPVIGEDDDFEVVIRQLDTPGNFEIAPIISHPRYQRETRLVLGPIHGDGKPRDGPAELAKSAMPVSQLSDPPLQAGIQLINDARVEPNARHEQKVSWFPALLLKQAEREMGGLGIEELTSRYIGAIAETNLVGKDVRGSAGKHAENDGIRRAPITGNAVYSLIDGAIATSGQNTLTTAIRRLRRNVSSRIRTGGGEQFDPVPGALENLNRAIEPRPFGPFEPARKRVENNANPLE